jgi:hypothetical protein
MPRRWLGRTYPNDIQDSIWNLSRALDDLMAGTMEFARLTDHDPSDEIRELNARLVNEIIIVSDKISDDEAKTRINELRGPIGNLQASFRQVGATGSLPAVPTVSGLAVIPREQAEDRLDQFKEAQRLYLEGVDRYVVARPAAEASLAMPVSGNVAGSMLADLDRRLDELDRDTNQVDEDFGRLESLLQEPGAALQIDRPTFDRMRLWISRINQFDQVLQRLEGLVGRKPAESPIMRAASIIPWWVFALVCAGALTGIAVLAATAAKK